MSKIIIVVLANLISIGIAQQGDVTYVCKVHTDFLEDHKVAMEPFGAPTGTPDDTCRGLMGRPLFEHNGAGADFSSANDCASYSAKLKETIELVASSGCCGPNKLSTCSATPPSGGGTNSGTHSGVSAAVDCTKCDDCAPFAYCMDPAKVDLNCHNAPVDCAARCGSCVSAAVDCSKCDDCAPFAYCMDPAKVDLNCQSAPHDCAARCGSCASAAVDCSKCDDCASFLYCMDPAKADLNCESAPHDCAARCISCVPAEYQQFIAVAISSLCGHGTILDAATNKCVLSYQNFIDRCRSEPHLSMCGNHKDESAAQCGGTPGSPGSIHGEPGNGGGHQENCHAVMSRKSLTCPVGTDARSSDDGAHSKSSNEWDAITNVDEIYRECCFGPTCGEKFDGICSGTKQLNKWHRPQMINEESCCSDNCHSIMGNQGLTCDGNKKLRGP